ncbi:methylaspartate mutase subunit E [Leisingera daeponensis]|uniref:Glutamate mutase epsilon subunit n=1 Tax=Leisingera daeponensis TaxID=405746 RepID=A0ABS7NJT4_9RHOB|nr:methylaspartate mutase subunit E [Leisingera daeponensis]MBY6141082.1 methylaspartate mutase subunit E [Leisingera daeponensis]
MTPEIANTRLSDDAFAAERRGVLQSWPTGAAVDFGAGVARQQSLPESKRFSAALAQAHAEGRTLLQPRAGVALLREHTALMNGLSPHCDLLPTTVDAYTRLNRYEDAQTGIDRSRAVGTSLLNGFPAVNHGVDGCATLVDAVDKPIQVRHGTPDARLLAEITLSAGFSSYEGGGISYNIPYAKTVPLQDSIRHWQYCDRLVGRYEEHGIRINREPFGPLTGTLVPPFVSHVVAIVEGLLALEQGVRCLTLGYGQAGNMVQDIAAMRSLRKLAHHYFQDAGYDDYALSTVFHQWMGGFPEDEAQATAVICLGALAARQARVTKIIVKTPHEASGVPTLEANIAGLRATRQMVNMIADQARPDSADIAEEAEIIEAEVHAVMRRIYRLGRGDVAQGIVLAFEQGVMDVPFAPAQANAGSLIPVRDNRGAVRIFDPGNVPLPKDVLAFHRDKIGERAASEGREASFDMVVDDVRAISASKLIGRPAA